jgi:hypothetical protein
MNDLEKRLAEIPLNPPPADWREAILTAAKEENPRAKVIGFPAFLRAHPVAWGALAACWLVIGGLNLSGPSRSEVHSLAMVPGKSPTAPQMAEYFERRQLLLRWPDATGAIFQIDRSKL